MSKNFRANLWEWSVLFHLKCSEKFWSSLGQSSLHSSEALACGVWNYSTQLPQRLLAKQWTWTPAGIGILQQLHQTVSPPPIFPHISIHSLVLNSETPRDTSTIQMVFYYK